MLATIGKIAGTALFYLPSGNGWREGVVVGAGMNGRGAVEIIVAQIGLSMGIISQEIFSILVFMAIITTAAVPLFLKWGSDWLRGRGELVRSEDERQGTVIVGAGPTGRALAKALAVTQPVWLIDKNLHHCREAEAAGLPVVHGSALDEEILSLANTAQAQAFLALTTNEEVNVLSAQLAQETFRVPKIRVLLSEGGQSLENLMQETKIQSLPPVWNKLSEWDHWLSRQNTTEQEIKVDASTTPEEFDMAGEQFLPLVVARNGTRRPFATMDELDPGDYVVALTR